MADQKGKPGERGNLNGVAVNGGRFKKGQSGNPGGRPKLAKVVIDAGYKPNELRKEVVQLAVEAIRSPDTDPASWRYAHDYVAGVLGIRPPKEFVIEDERAVLEIDERTLTDEQLDQAIAAADKLIELGVINETEEAAPDDDPPVTH